MPLTPQQQQRLEEFSRAAVRSENSSGVTGSSGELGVLGVPAELTVAQAILETGWGKHIPGNNPFGIKRAARHAAGAVLGTQEVEDGETQSVQAEFAVFPSLEAAFADHAWLISHGAPYQSAWEDYQKNRSLFLLVHAIAPVYATDPEYATKIIGIISRPDVVQAIKDARITVA